MKLYTSTRAPNPRRVDIFLAEKGIEVPRVEIDIMKQEHKAPDFIARNPMMRVPVLELDDGTHIAESIAICRYFEELQPAPPLFGVDMLDRALVEMWQRRMELDLMVPVAMAFRHTHPAMAELETPQVAEWGEVNKPRIFTMLDWLDGELADRPFIAGQRYTVADITALVAIDFMRPVRLGVPESCTNVLRWYADVSGRPSAGA
ncbi:glutathione S-transferase family protein [Microbaculum marinisediminis]|uniref:Glutathione S-transferase n=1 Tax=Microbaculum marinisediminis TaxID=2931392 RepID=A0AAW5QXT6_9HYPH|nr:glutathione S-transferase [Microbaculum sp. A6E488]MCT8971105.1 glutathione S-transferase [Microbaculum sp. A6E488]